MRRKFLISFLIFSIISIVFFRPLIFKREVKIEFDRNVVLDTIYYSHGFPITTLVAEAMRSEDKEYNLIVEPVSGEVWISKRFESDVDRVIVEAENWRKFGFYLISDSQVEPIQLKIRASNFILIPVDSQKSEGTLKIKVNDDDYYFDLRGQNKSKHLFIDVREPNNFYKLFISPESRGIILKFTDNVSNLKLRNFNYEVLDSTKIFIKNLGIDYIKVVMNSILVIAYSFIFSAILVYSRSVFLKNFSIIFTIFLIYLLAYFPGIFYADSWNQTKQAYYLLIDDWHTPFHTLTIATFLKFFHSVGIYTLFQILFSSVILAWIFKKLNVRDLKLTFIFALPILALHFISILKDIPYSVVLIWFSFLIYLGFKDNKYLESNLNLIAFIVSITLIMLLRHNGVILGLVCLFLMFFVFKRHVKRNIIVLASVISIFLTFQFLFYKVLDVKRTWIGYVKDIFILAAYVSENYKFSDSEKEIIKKIFYSLDGIKSLYKCSSSVSITIAANSEVFNQYGNEVRKIVLRAIIKDPITFVKHQVCSSRYIWGLSRTSMFPSPYKLQFSINREFPRAKLYHDLKLPQIQLIIEKFLDGTNRLFKLLTLHILIFYTLILLFIFKKHLRLLIAPSLINTAILTVVSVSFDSRYLLSNYLLLVILVIYFLSNRIYKSPLKF